MASHHSQGSGAAARRDWLSAEAKAKLEAVVEHIGQPGKGISACDESFSTIDPRFRAVGIEPTEEHRRAYRQCLFEAEGAPEYVAGAILDPETVFQMSDAGAPTPPQLQPWSETPWSDTSVRHALARHLVGQASVPSSSGPADPADPCRRH